MGCLTGNRFTMRADILKQSDISADPINPDSFGTWHNNQDPLTGDIVRVWVPYPDDVNTTDVNEATKFGTIRCIVRGIVDGGIRVAGTTERFGTEYTNVEFVKMWCPPDVHLTKRDRITNIRSKQGHVFWQDEEFGGTPRATVFNVNGVTPLFDAFNNHVENFVLLERAEI